MIPKHLVFLHGFTQTGAIWATFADTLGRRVGSPAITTPDLPGHGSAGEQALDLPATADHLAATVDPGIVIGYSMGGRVALHLAVAHPDRVRALVVIGAHPGLESAEERRIRRLADEAQADEIERIGVDAFVTEWLAQPLFAGLTVDRADLAARRSNTATGLATSLRTAGLGTQVPLWERLGEIDCPLLAIAGENDTKFTALAERTAERVGDAMVAIIPGAGHAVHLEQPQATVEAIAGWIDRLADPDSRLSRGR